MNHALPPAGELACHWQLDPRVVMLNHGSFGGTPTAILDLQRRWRDQIEREPVRFFVEELEPLLDQARVQMAAFVGCDPDDFAFVGNATMGVNTIVNSLRFEPGDELLVSNHEYNACNNAFHAAAKRWQTPPGGPGPVVKFATIPFPTLGPDEIERRIMDAVTPRTKLVLLSHITSPSGIILPVERIVAQLNARGVDTLVDGAHVPGHMPLNVASLGCAYYTGNFHKWLCAPKGAAFLWVRKDRQDRILPLVISHGFNSPRSDRSRFRLNFDFSGTVDPSPWLSAPACVHMLPTLVAERNWLGVMNRCRNLCLAGRDLLCQRLGVAPPAPAEMVGNLGAVILPEHPAELDDRITKRATKYQDALQDILVHQYGIQVPIIRLPGLGAMGRSVRMVRISAMLYNAMEQYDYLAQALVRELDAERLL